MAAPARVIAIAGARPVIVVLNGASLADVGRSVAVAAACRHAPLVVGVDGGLRACRRAGLAPDLLVGDADSVRRPPADVPAVLYDRDKDLSDFAAALDLVARRGVDLVVVAGLAGGRLDHEWSNLFELGRVARRFRALIAPTGRGTVVVTARGCGAEAEPGATVSLFALTAGAEVTLRGTRWTLDRARIRPGSRGLSNVMCGRRLRLAVHRGTVALVFPGR